jgi:flagellar basal body-associated protein FliL
MVEDLPPSPTVPEPAKQSNTTLIIIIIVVILLCCCCAVIALGAWWLWVNGDQLLNNLNYSFQFIQTMV